MPATKASEMDPKFIKKIKDQYGEVDMVNDYFDLEDSVYYKTVDINKCFLSFTYLNVFALCHLD